MNVQDSSIVTTPGASEPQGSAMVSGAGVYIGTQVAGSPGSSSSNRESTWVASQSPATLDAISADVARAVASQVVPAYSRTKTATRKVIDIGALSGGELLDKLQGYINSMCAFALGTRNVHKELKDTLANLRTVMLQYTRC